MYPKELVKLLKQNGWQQVSQNRISCKTKKNGNQTEIVPIHNKDMKKGLLNEILKRTGLK